ncbi:MAG: aspartate carbamoyltransferase regulatory subunit [Euryarchaeota archaeon]|nr:aspartate carbamoyltransferase regulatory subunit [Euryarchaeota archaeon]
MKGSKKELIVRPIKDGTVIDHITPGKALSVLRILGIPKKHPNTTVSVIINVPSKKMGLKDIVKVERRELKETEANKITLIAPHATINIIRNYKVIEKRKVELPNVIEGIVKCANPNCITNTNEAITPKFTIERREPIRLRCCFCERTMESEMIEQLL